LWRLSHPFAVAADIPLQMFGDGRTRSPIDFLRSYLCTHNSPLVLLLFFSQLFLRRFVLKVSDCLSPNDMNEDERTSNTKLSETVRPVASLFCVPSKSKRRLKLDPQKQKMTCALLKAVLEHHGHISFV
jgi:hypothetical protein